LLEILALDLETTDGDRFRQSLVDFVRAFLHTTDFGLNLRNLLGGLLVVKLLGVFERVGRENVVVDLELL